VGIPYLRREKCLVNTGIYINMLHNFE
jgi:hypothetical protein